MKLEAVTDMVELKAGKGPPCSSPLFHAVRLEEAEVAIRNCNNLHFIWNTEEL